MVQRNAAVRRVRVAAFAAALLTGLLQANAASAQIGSERYASIVVDARTGSQLSGASPDELRHPASLTKMMTLYMVFEAIREGRLGLDGRLYMTEEAASRPPSKLGIPPGISISVEQAILALVTKSANDVASLFGQTMGGSEERFGQMMTMRARALGMSNTVFRNASGLPDFQQVTTARDMATLGRRLYIDFPERYHYFATTTARIGSIALRNHNRMLGEYEGVDGIKTGYITASGFNIVTSAQRQGQRVVATVFGGSSWVERDRHAALLLDEGFSRLGVQPSAAPLPLVARTVPNVMLGRAEAATARAALAPRGGAPAPRLVSRAAGPRVAARAAGRARVRTAEVAPSPPTSRRAVPMLRAARAGTARVVEQGDGGRAVRVTRPQLRKVGTAAPAPDRPAPRAKAAARASGRR